MVEVFKTNVNERYQADNLLDKIHAFFNGYQANFDLEDRDKILRIESAEPIIEAEKISLMLKEMGFYAEVLTDEIHETVK